MTSSPRQSISVAMATYNGAAYVLSQLRSIAAQTHQPDEIVIGDDRSSDNTMALIEEFSRGVSIPIRPRINAVRLGPIKNFEEAISRCRGDIVVLSDQDDLWRDDKLQRIETAFRENPAATYVFSNGIQIDAAGHPLKPSLWDSALFWQDEQALYLAGRGSEVLLRHNVVTGAALALRRAAILMALPFDPGLMHDYWIASILEASACGVALDESLISYRRHSAQQQGLFAFSNAIKFARLCNEDYCAKEAGAFRRLADRIERNGAPEHLCIRLREKAIFYERRSDMRRHPLRAPAQIIRSWWLGDYKRFTARFKFIPLAVPLDLLSSFLALLGDGRQG